MILGETKGETDYGKGTVDKSSAMGNRRLA